MNILITGGLGYIGSHIALLFAQAGYQVIIIDHAAPITSPLTQLIIKLKLPIHLITGDFADKKILYTITQQFTIDAVVHCAAFIEVGESVKNPTSYYHNNVIKTIYLLDWLVKTGIKKFIFSSSCAVYGTPQKLPLYEDHPKNPVSPYGKTKLITEILLEDYAHAYTINYVSLRYFNAAGASPEYGLGELHKPESHIIPLALKAAYQAIPFTIFGTTYPTPDGTGIRDYLHVKDLAQAHVQAYQYLAAHGNSVTLNLGTGIGYSVQQIITSIEKITNSSLKKIIAAARPGDPTVLVANAEQAQKLLNWQPLYSNLENIINTAHQFHKNISFNTPVQLPFLRVEL